MEITKMKKIIKILRKFDDDNKYDLEYDMINSIREKEFKNCIEYIDYLINEWIDEMFIIWDFDNELINIFKVFKNDLESLQIELQTL